MIITNSALRRILVSGVFLIPIAAQGVEPMISAGGSHSVFLSPDSRVWGQGDNLYGQLGSRIGSEGASKPKLILNAGSTWDETDGYKAVSASTRHTLCLREDGRVVALGVEDGTQQDSDGLEVSQMEGVSAVSAGQQFSLVLKKDGTAWGAGQNWYGQLGNGTHGWGSMNYEDKPIKIMSDVAAISGGGSHSLFLKNDGTVWACGRNRFGQLGDGTTEDRDVPVRVNITGTVKAISAGLNHSLFLMASGEVKASGDNQYGQLGNGATYPVTYPTISHETSPVTVFSNVAAMSAGGWHSLFLGKNGGIWACGRNSEYQLGDGTNIERRKPVYVTPGGLQQAVGFRSVSAGAMQSLFVDNRNKIWMSGRDQLTAKTALTMVFALPAAQAEIDLQSPKGKSVDSKVNCGRVKPLAKKVKTIYVKNYGERTLMIKNMRIKGADKEDFKLSRYPSSIPPNSTKSFKLTFQPSGKGRKNARLVLKCNDRNEGQIDLMIKGSAG